MPLRRQASAVFRHFGPHIVRIGPVRFAKPERMQVAVREAAGRHLWRAATAAIEASHADCPQWRGLELLAGVEQYPTWAQWKEDLAWFDDQIAALDR
jgi:hypothetical protein